MLVFGGSLGARSINLAAVEAFAGGDLPRAARQRTPRLPRAGAQAAAGQGYDLREYLDLEDFADALSAADLVVARAGGSVFEIAAHGLPAILVPYPHAAADHQSANARWMAEAGAAVVDRRRRAERAAPGARGGGAAGRPRAPAAMARASRGLARPRCRREVAARAAGGGARR